MKKLMIFTVCLALLLCGCAGGKEPVNQGGGTTTAATTTAPTTGTTEEPAATTTTTAPTAATTTAPQSEKLEIGGDTIVLGDVTLHYGDSVEKVLQLLGEANKVNIGINPAIDDRYQIYYHYDHFVLEAWAPNALSNIPTDPAQVLDQEWVSVWITDDCYSFDGVSVGSTEAKLCEKTSPKLQQKTRYTGSGFIGGYLYSYGITGSAESWRFYFDIEDGTLQDWKDGDKLPASAKIKGIGISL